MSRVRPPARGGGPTEGRMPYGGLVSDPVPAPPTDGLHRPPAAAPMQARYVAGLYSPDERAEVLRRPGGPGGLNRAERWIGLTDGGNGLASFVPRSFPLVEVVILDFWHVADHLGDLARAPHPQDDEQASEPKGQWCHALKHQGGAALVEIREELTLPERRPAGRAQHAEVLGYLRQNVPRRDYPASIATGWHLGSGAVASAGQAVVAQRLELAGMRWRDKGTDAVCPLRARYRRERSQWQHFWRRNYQR